MTTTNQQHLEDLEAAMESLFVSGDTPEFIGFAGRMWRFVECELFYEWNMERGEPVFGPPPQERLGKVDNPE